MEYTLVLKEEDARFICEITERVGGEPIGPRGTFDKIRDQLRNQGIRHNLSNNKIIITQDINKNGEQISAIYLWPKESVTNQNLDRLK